MGYRRFKSAEAASTPATLATFAALHDEEQADRAALIVEAYRVFLRGRRVTPAGERAVRVFLEQFWGAAIAAGWSDVELFGAHPDPALAWARISSMGAVTLSAATGDPISDVQPNTIRYTSGLSFLRGERTPSEPIWDVVFLNDGAGS